MCVIYLCLASVAPSTKEMFSERQAAHWHKPCRQPQYMAPSSKAYATCPDPGVIRKVALRVSSARCRGVCSRFAG